MRKLPFLNGIRAFEAAARAGSFAKAAGELQRHAGGDQPDGATAGAAPRRAAVRAQGEPAGAAPPAGPRLSGRPDAALRSAGQPDRAGHRDGRLARADRRRRADLRDALAHSAACGFPEAASRTSRCASRPAARPCPTTRTGPAASGSATATGRGSTAEQLFAADLHAGLLARDGEAAEDAGRSCATSTLLRVAHAPDEWPRWFKAAGLVEDSREGTGVRILRPGAAGGRRRRRRGDRHQALCRRRSRRPGGWSRRSRSRCRRASTGI